MSTRAYAPVLILVFDFDTKINSWKIIAVFENSTTKTTLAKGLLKTEEENQKLKNHDILLKQIEEDNNYFKVFAQDVHNNIATYPELLAKMIKESTDFLMKNFDKWYDELKMELVNHVKDTLGSVIEGIQSQDQAENSSYLK